MIEWDPFEIRASQAKVGKIDRSASDEDLFEAWPSDRAPQEFLGRSLNRKRLFGIFLLMLVGFTVILHRAYNIQVIQGEYHRRVAEGNRIRVVPVKAPRGLIYDRQGRLLVKNIPSFNLMLTPADLPAEQVRRENLFQEISQVIKGEQSAEFINKLEQLNSQAKDPYQSIIIEENIEYEKALVTRIKSKQWPGISLAIERVRNYDNGPSAALSHVLGYLGRVTEDDLANNLPPYLLTDQLGRAGLELSYEKQLRGVDGKEQIEVDAIGKVKKILARESPISGQDLVLSIDQELQNKLSQLLIDHLNRSGKTKAAAVVLDPNNGQVLAMVSLPSYDNNAFARGIGASAYQKIIDDGNLPLFNRVISGEYPSGSTFKSIVAAAGLEEGVITPSTGINSFGGIRVSLWFFPDWKAGGHGYTTVAKALAESVNTFFYFVGGGYEKFKGLGVSKIIKYAKKFGLGERLGIDLPAEQDGFLPTPEWKEDVKNERWYIGDTYHLAIGQGDLLVTPLQLAAATAAFANGGIIYQPQVVKGINVDGSNLLIKPAILNQNFISAEHLAVVSRGMREAVLYGSAVSLNQVSETVAGKTGTAQWHSEKKPHAWFTGFAPYPNAELVITILIEEGGEGSAASVPLAKDFLNWYFSNYKPNLSAAVDKQLDGELTSHYRK